MIEEHKERREIMPETFLWIIFFAWSVNGILIIIFGSGA
jgi:hypothetical protein